MNIFIEWLIEPLEAYDTMIETAAAAALAAEGISQPLELSVTIVDNDEIRQINQEQRDMDKATDVLSFPMIAYEAYDSVAEAIAMEPVNQDTGLVYLGDIVISWDKVIEQSEAYGHSLDRELSFLVVHSMLHLLGYDHMVPEEEAEMISRQKIIMSKLGLER